MNTLHMIVLLLVIFFMTGCVPGEVGVTARLTSSPTAALATEVLTQTVAVSASRTVTPTFVTAIGVIPTPTIRATLCDLQAVVVPTLPAVIPGYAELDTSIGLHVTGHYQVIDVESYRLKITGLVETPLELSYDELRCMTSETRKLLLVCDGFFEDEATWTGVPLPYVLKLSGIQPTVKEIELISADGYKTTLDWTEGFLERNLLAYAVKGEVLPILHGFPIRAVIAGDFGNKWVKWLVEIRVK